MPTSSPFLDNRGLSCTVVKDFLLKKKKKKKVLRDFNKKFLVGKIQTLSFYSVRFSGIKTVNTGQFLIIICIKNIKTL